MLESALQLATLGYAVFPCAPGQKRPATQNGLLDASADAELVDAMFRAAPSGCNLAMRTDGLLVIDIDGADNPWLKAEPEKLLSLADAPLSLTPRGGRHYIFRQPDGMRFRNTAGKLAEKVDTRADGGYILVPPSVVDGKSYQWGQQLDCDPERLPLPPEWLVGQLSVVSRQLHASGEFQQLTTDNRQLTKSNAIPDGQRNGTLTRLAGTMRRSGMSESEILAALRQANAGRCKPPLDDHEVMVIAGSVARYEPDQIAVAIAEDHAGQDGIGVTAPRQKLGPFPDSLLSVPGFISEVIDWNLAGAYKPQPVLALAGALSLLAVLTGRKVADPYGTRTNLYCLAVGRTGCGKERAREVNKQILHQAGLDGLVGPEGMASHSGLTAAVQLQPAILFQMDEIGRVLKTLGNPNQSPFLYGIATVLMKLFTSSGSIYKGDAYADAKKNVVIYQPHVCLYGTTVPKSLYEGLTTDSISDGFLSRMLIFETPDNPQGKRPLKLEVPKRLVETARYWGDLRPGGNLSSETPQPRIVDYTQEAIERLAELELLATRQQESGEATAALWTRTSEKAAKLALLWACSENHVEPIIGRQAAEWASQASEFLTRKLLEIAEEHVSENQFQANQKRVARIISDAGPEGISAARLARSLQWLKARDRHEILELLMEIGKVRLETITADNRGRPRTVYVGL